MCVPVCPCVYTLFSSSLCSSEAKSAGTVGLQKLLSQTETLSLTAASLVCIASGGGDCGDSLPAGRDGNEKELMYADEFIQTQSYVRG